VKICGGRPNPSGKWTYLAAVKTDFADFVAVDRIRDETHFDEVRHEEVLAQTL